MRHAVAAACLASAIVEAFPWQAGHRQSDIRCDDSCVDARNGLCNDGSQTQGTSITRRITCDFGTDCTDCANKVGIPARMATLREMMPMSGGSEASPAPQQGAAGVALLRERKVELNAAWTKTQPPFIMPFTDPEADIDVSRNMAAGRTVEPLYNLYWHRLSAKCCAAGGLMLDVGANFGYYSLLAAKMGCRVVAWEPIPVFRAFVEAGLKLNNLSHRVHLRPTVVSDTAGQQVSMTVPLKGIWGTASVGGLNVDPSIPSPKYVVHATSETLDQVVTEQPCIMKLDVEGYEPSVLAGAKRLLAKYPPRAILTEYTPGVQERRGAWARLGDYPRALRMLHEAGYRIWHLVGTDKGDRKLLDADWGSARLPALAEVTDETLHAEEMNARNMMADNVPGVGFSVPWDLHPKSLHAEFAHNTDLLLTLERGPHAIEESRRLVTRGRAVGVSSTSPFGLGGGLCVHVLRDGTAQEMVGRLCVDEDRNASIALAIEMAEAQRPLAAGVTWHSHVRREARKWRLDGPMRSTRRRMRRQAKRLHAADDASAPGGVRSDADGDGGVAKRSRGRGRRGRGRGRGDGRGPMRPDRRGV